SYFYFLKKFCRANFFIDILIFCLVKVLRAEEKHIRSVKSAATDRGECLTAERGFCLGGCRLEEAVAAFFLHFPSSPKMKTSSSNLPTTGFSSVGGA
ncbi:MAG: hypothetical protein IJM72_05060, partial [Deltaproteobacteria bacterium]|nr:hypothetical protein [Deltaproteobacteria bacterium]